MVNFVLNYLCSPTCEILSMRFHLKRLELHFYCFISFAFSWATEKRQTAFLGVVRAVLFDDLGIEHHRIGRSSSTLIEERNDAFAHANHIRRHADTAFSVRHQRVKQVLCDLQIFFRCDLRPPCEENGIVHKFFNHTILLSPDITTAICSKLPF